ncbi:TetR/AcrR family transcriptional regulator [Cryptosporangium phraense]|uniref:TetR family transcriptional regulator n=1 Tax=Cryptosporangium phraense TaxID=2593070 RepID=A0A545AWD1_9ACTN|nr:TetR/AcrR family transcriptional regulator [Cryptosporangium phraense]TQS45636.1 TetR family transcriptional regulator [Cryptosporangium phraense]
MARWEPGVRERLLMAALDAFTEEGFEQTTVAGLAERAGVTERTFFRHFADKREVLFQGSSALQDGVTQAIAAAPDGLDLIEVVTRAFESVGPFFAERHEFARRRAAAIASNTSLLERELLKLSALKAANADALRARGVPDADAVLAAEFGAAIFHVGFQRWVDDSTGVGLDRHVRQVADDLKALITRG